jgi:hypothetical protein
MYQKTVSLMRANASGPVALPEIAADPISLADMPNALDPVGPGEGPLPGRTHHQEGK